MAHVDKKVKMKQKVKVYVDKKRKCTNTKM